MEENERSIRSLIVQYLVAHTQCSGCGRRYSAGDVHLRHRRGDVWLASVVCRHCGLQGLIMAAISADYGTESASPADAEMDERAILHELGPIDLDEVLDFHRLLSGFGGDMLELLGSSNEES